MRIHLAALAFLAVLGPGVAQAQQPAGTLQARLVPGVAHQYGIFGDDSPRSQQGMGITLGGHLLARRSDRFDWVFEGALNPQGLQNPHFDESVTSLYFQFGPEFGRRVHVRPTLGIALQNWSGARSCQCLGMAPAGGMAVGFERAAGSHVRITPELFARGSITHGAFTSSLGVQVGFGWKR